MHRVVSLLCLCSLLLAACGPRGNENEEPLPGLDPSPAPTQPSSPPAASAGTTISFAAAAYEMHTYEAIAASFHEENPSIKVVIVPMHEVENSNENMTASGEISRLRTIVTGADTAALSSISPEVAASGMLLDMKPMMDADASFKKDDFYPGVLERSTFERGLVMLPRYAWVHILAYNKDLFKAAGLPDPKPDWTWNDLFGAASQIAAQDDKTYGFFDYSNGMINLFSQTEAPSLKLFSTPASDVDLTQPELVHALEQVRGQIDSHTIYGASGKSNSTPSDPQQLIRDGRVGIFPSPMSNAYNEGSSEGDSYPFTMGQINYPQSDALIASLNTNMLEGYIISAGTQHPNEAWKWIEYLSRTMINEGTEDTAMMSRTGRIPARQRLAEATKFWDGIDAETKDAFQHALARQVANLRQTPDYNVFGPLVQAVTDVTDNSVRPAVALKAAQEQLVAQLADNAQSTPTPAPPTGPVVVATPAPQTAPEGAATLVFNPLTYDTVLFRKLANAFNIQNNGYFVQIKDTDVVPENLEDAAKSADCFGWWDTPQRPNEFAALLDLQPLFSADATFKQDDFPPAVLSQMTSNGGIYGMPYTFGIRYLGYNKTLFDAAGIETPKYTWRPDDFLTAAKALTSGSGSTKQYGYIPLGATASDMAFFIDQFGGQLVTGSGKDMQPNFSDPTVVKAIQWYIDLAKVHGVMPKFTFPYRPDDSVGGDNSYDIIQSGRAGMWSNIGYGSFNEDSSSGSSWDEEVAPLPIGGAGIQQDDLWVRGFYISAKTQQQQGCWEWLKFITADVGSLDGDLPARRSVASSQAFLSSANDIQIQILKIYGDALRQPTKVKPSIDDLLYTPQYGFDPYWFYKAIDDTIINDANLAEGLKEAEELTKATMKCVAETQKPAACAKQSDPGYDGLNTEGSDPDSHDTAVDL